MRRHPAGSPWRTRSALQRPLHVLALALAIACLACERNEPRAGGQPLSHWKREARLVSFLSFWNSSKDERRREAFRRLVEIGEPAVPVLLDLWLHESVPVSGDALNALAALGPRAEAAVPSLISEIRDAERGRRTEAMLILGRIGEPARAAIPALTLALRDTNPRIAAVAASALSQLGPDATATLESAARDRDAGVREAAVLGMAALPRPGPGAPRDPADTRRRLAAALDDPSPEVRAAGIRSLFTGYARELDLLTDLLVRAMRDSSAVVRAAAGQAFTGARQHSGETPRMLSAVLSAALDPGPRQDAAWGLSLRLAERRGPMGLAGDDSAVAAQALVRALEDSDVKVRIYSARALAASGGEIAPRLIRLLQRELPGLDAEMSVRAAAVLWTLTTRIGDVGPAFERGLASDNRWTRREAIAEIMKIRGPAAPLVPSLERLLASDPDREIRELAGRAIALVNGTR